MFEPVQDWCILPTYVSTYIMYLAGIPSLHIRLYRLHCLFDMLVHLPWLPQLQIDTMSERHREALHEVNAQAAGEIECSEMSIYSLEKSRPTCLHLHFPCMRPPKSQLHTYIFLKPFKAVGIAAGICQLWFDSVVSIMGIPGNFFVFLGLNNSQKPGHTQFGSECLWKQTQSATRQNPQINVPQSET